MKKLLFVVCVIFMLGCDSDQSLDCFKNTGDIVQQEFELDGFHSIIVFKRVQLIIAQGEKQEVIIETGDNLLRKIKVRVEDSILKVSNRNACNFIREHGVTKVIVTTPNIRSIRNSSGLTVESRGVIGFPELDLVSEDRGDADEFHIDGDFRMTLDVGTVRVNSSGISKFYLDGRANNGIFGIFDRDARIEAADLEVKKVQLFHRGTNRMIVYPTESIKGKIVSLGDVISKNRPPVVEVEELFTGKLIFQ